jgi:hypothetical protein
VTCPTSPSADPARLAALALRQVGELLGRLDPEQLAALAAGRGRLVFQPAAPVPAVVPAPATVPAVMPAPATVVATVPAPAPPAGPHPADTRAPRAPGARTVTAEPGELEDTVRAIKALRSRAEVADYLRAHDDRLTVPVLKQVARRLGPTVATGRSKAELKRNIIEGTAGFRERSMAMSRGAWS